MAVSPVALWAGRALASWNSLATPPVFERIEAAPINPAPTRVEPFAPREVVPPVPLPADLPSRLRPVPGKTLRFIAVSGAHEIEFRPLTESDRRFAVYSQLDQPVTAAGS